MRQATQEAAAQSILQPQYTDNPQNISLQMYFKVAVKNKMQDFTVAKLS